MSLPRSLKSSSVALLFGVLGIYAFGLENDAPELESQRFVVGSFNVRFDGIGEDTWAWPRRRDRVALAIRHSDAHIIGLQEITSWEGLYAVSSRQIPDLIEDLPNFAIVGHSPQDKIWSSNPILYRPDLFVVEETGVLFFARDPERFPQGWWGDMTARFARWVRFSFVGDPERTILVVNAHYSPVRLYHRWRSSGILARHVPKLRLPGEPLVVLGDLNARPGRPSIQRLLRRLALSDTLAADPGGSFNRGRREARPGRIDYVLASEQLYTHRSWIDTRVFSGELASDHFPVYSEFLLGPVRPGRE